MNDCLFVVLLVVDVLEFIEIYEADMWAIEFKITTLELEQQELTSLQRKRTIWGLSILILLLIVSGVLYFRYRNNVSSLKTKQRVYEERSRISKDLHDNVGAQLTAMSTRIDLLEGNGENQSTELSNIKEEAAGTISMLRDTIWAMHREEFTIDQFMDRLRQYAQKVVPSSLKIHQQFDDSLRDFGLSSSQALNLFRIAQEAIQNTMKHADASRIRIDFKNSGDCRQLLIADNGIGKELTENPSEESYGLQNMRERSAEINGKLKFLSSKGKGFKVQVEF